MRTLGRIAPRLPSSWADVCPFVDLRPPTYEGLLASHNVPAKHSSLNRQLEWERSPCANRLRPDFKIYTGNDLPSIWSYMAPTTCSPGYFALDYFALRDAIGLKATCASTSSIDVLQYSDSLPSAYPTAAYKHLRLNFCCAAGFPDNTHPQSPCAQLRTLKSCKIISQLGALT
jgi:hypothetical protein